MRKYVPVPVPATVNNDIAGFQRLAAFAAESLLWIQNEVALDFDGCTFFAGHLCAVLGDILQGLGERNNSISFLNMSAYIKGFLSSNKFLAYFGEFGTATIPEYHYSIQRF